MTKIGFFIGILVLLLVANTCSAAGLSLSIVPENGTTTVEPGKTISYIATVRDDGIGDPTDPGFDQNLIENVQFSINRTIQGPWSNPNWNYEFVPPTVRLESSNDSKSSTLTLQIPEDVTPGTYYHTVEASAKNQYDEEMELTGRITVNVINTDVNNIPEFPSIALPVAAILGLVAIFGRRKE